jgi:hypothetical protein
MHGERGCKRVANAQAIISGPSAAWLSATSSEGIQEADRGPPPRIPGGSPTPWVSPHISYPPCLQSFEIGLHPCGRGQVTAGDIYKCGRT